MWGSRTRYLCTNVTGCEYARRDHVYWYGGSAETPQCTGTDADGCGKALVAAGTANRAPIYVIAGLICLSLLGYLGINLYQFINPRPLTGYGFAVKTSEIEESGTVVSIKIIRNPDVLPAVVHYKTENRTAIASLDYMAEQGSVVFKDGEIEKTVDITILPDNLHTEGVEEFMFVLTNTQHKQKHIVFIQEPSGSAESITSAQALVRNLSGVAMDVAAYGNRVTTIFELLQSGAIKDQALFLEYHEVQETNESNLRKSRERYIDIIRDLKTISPEFVDRAFEQWLANLQSLGYYQQHDATRLASEHYHRFLSDGIINMEIWAAELREIVPDLETSDNSDSSSGI